MKITRLPLFTHLLILQLENYQTKRYCKWYFGGNWSGNVGDRSNLVWTSRMKLTLITVFGQLILLMVAVGLDFKLLLIASLMVLILPVPFVIMANLIISMGVNYYLYKEKRFIQRMLIRSKLKVIGVTGSYGKTSVKEYLYRLLDNYEYSLRTPKSYNTIWGIGKTLRDELTDKHQFFVCEMGAFGRGEIKELANLVKPSWGMVTAIGSQHLERFGNIENTVKAKFELVNYVGRKQSLVNLDNAMLAKLVELPENEGLLTYSLDNSKAIYRAIVIDKSIELTTFDLVYRGNKEIFTTRLVGKVHLSNLVGALAMAIEIGVPVEILQKTTPLLCPPEHRFELINYGNMTVVDNTYSSNVVGFEEMLKEMQLFKGKKALITPGIVELGNKTEAEHFRLGKLVAKVFDQVILTGDNIRTQSLKQGMKAENGDSAVEITKKTENPWKLVETLMGKVDVVVMENDVPGNYN